MRKMVANGIYSVCYVEEEFLSILWVSWKQRRFATLDRILLPGNRSNAFRYFDMYFIIFILVNVV